MKLLQAEIENFGSYKHLTFDFTGQGLTLIQGPTGSGKSTLMDIATWCLFGQTAKGGSVNEVRNWDNKDTPTKGVLTVQTPTGIVKVTRIRGTPQENDLYYEEANSESKIRGKDLTETQKSLEIRLGINYSIFVAGSYFNEFSDTVSFFNARAGEKRQLFNKIANLEFANKIIERSKERSKECRKLISNATTTLANLSGQLSQLKRTIENAQKTATDWDEREKERVENRRQYLYQSIEERTHTMIFSADQIEALSKRVKGKCSECGAERDEATRNLIDQHKRTLDRLKDRIEQDKKELVALKEQPNPYDGQLRDASLDLIQVEGEITILQEVETSLTSRLSSFEQLQELSQELKAEMLRNTVKQAEDKANQILESHFDAPLRLEFTLEGADDLVAGIKINGKECVYTQLSKGQRQLLKLSFAVAVMGAVSNQSGVHFSQLFFDEALDGLDGELKVKAISLFESLSTSHESVFLIDHAQELQIMVPHTYRISIENGDSQLEIA